MEGYVYVISAPELGRVKIGWTRSIKSLRSRFRDLQCGSPCELRLHSAKHHNNVEYAEAALHKRFRAAHIRGEWFDITHPKVARWMEERELQGFLWATPPPLPNGRPPQKLNRAINHLIEQFSDGEPILATDVLEGALEYGISKRTLETAKAQLGIKSIKILNQWWWVQA
jgi:hypothetical protein